MPTTIDNTADVIDSRDIIARIEELQAKRTPWAAGWNMPGYMPDSEPVAFPDWSSAQAYILDELRRAADETETGAAALTVVDTLERLSAAEEGDWCETVEGYAYWISFEGRDTGLDAAEQSELVALEALAKQGEDYAADWEHGETLIRDSYFKAYAQELAEEIGAISPSATWPNTCIDWDQAARELRMDYTAVEFGSVTYWVR
jgi:hypothetical protein